jgi:oligopeptide/dipeptide ABC transporter ATP-binding protein
MTDRLLEIDNLITRFYTEDGIVNAVERSTFHLSRGETLGIVGESGSGKTVTAFSIIQLIENPGRIVGGTVRFNGTELLDKSEKEMQRIRGKEIAMVFQDSLSSLNPTMTIGRQIGRVLKFHTDLSKRKIHARVVALLKEVGIPEPEKRTTNFPHEFSGGMRQRALIAMAISCNPALLILDEPTTALDVTIEAQIFELIETLKEEFEMGILLITHDLAVVASACERVIIMYAGRIVEEARVGPLYEHPLHPYTQGLLNSIPKMESEGKRKRALFSIPGEVPDLIHLPAGCNFSPRCRHAVDRCWQVDPALEEVQPGRRVACLRVHEING